MICFSTNRLNQIVGLRCNSLFQLVVAIDILLYEIESPPVLFVMSQTTESSGMFHLSIENISSSSSSSSGNYYITTFT